MRIWEDILNYPLIDTRSKSLSEKTISEIQNNPELSQLIDIDHNEGFVLTPINIIIFIVIFLATKLLLKYLKRYFKAFNLDDKQIKIEGREFTFWKVVKQFIYFLMVYLMFLSLNVNNDGISLSSLLVYDFIRVGSFHVAVYHIFLIVLVVFITLNFH